MIEIRRITGHAVTRLKQVLMVGKRCLVPTTHNALRWACIHFSCGSITSLQKCPKHTLSRVLTLDKQTLDRLRRVFPHYCWTVDCVAMTWHYKNPTHVQKSRTPDWKIVDHCHSPVSGTLIAQIIQIMNGYQSCLWIIADCGNSCCSSWWRPTSSATDITYIRFVSIFAQGRSAQSAKSLAFSEVLLCTKSHAQPI